ncbi:MAG: hypothetical protein ACLTT1_08385 [[Clostridium] scindens]
MPFQCKAGKSARLDVDAVPVSRRKGAANAGGSSIRMSASKMENGRIIVDDLLHDQYSGDWLRHRRCHRSKPPTCGFGSGNPCSGAR